MTTKTGGGRAPAGYDPSQFPAFAVTVDIVILTMSDSRPHVLLVSRGVAPFKGRWAIPGGFKRPGETLDQAAKRELAEETGVDSASLLTQFGAYGDPGRDPRMNVVTVAYLAVLRDVGAIVAGSDAAHAALIPVAEALNGKIELAFDHAQIVRNAVERVRVDLDLTGIATAFVGPTFTLAELRAQRRESDEALVAPNPGRGFGGCPVRRDASRHAPARGGPVDTGRARRGVGRAGEDR